MSSEKASTQINLRSAGHIPAGYRRRSVSKGSSRTSHTGGKGSHAEF